MVVLQAWPRLHRVYYQTLHKDRALLGKLWKRPNLPKFLTYSGAKGVWCANVVSMITNRKSDHRSDHNVLKWESRFTLGLNAARNTDYIKQCFKQKLFKIKFPKKTHGRIPLFIPGVKLGGSKDYHF